ncbi:MFS transporter [Oceanobacter mangrovi]|uniref:MFS transporter n=1 Tax=Oceanobacter mangrovi TaxID=2862510 RepID=UPI001C8E3F33|nr:MFS transporter [Oceanobacter mangrovi]
MIKTGSQAWWRITIALCLGSFMVFTNLYVTQPLLPMLAREFGVSPLQASYSLTISTLTLGAALIFYGAASDAIGRRWLMLGSMGGIVIMALSLSLVTDYHTLLVLRAIQGLFLAGLPAIAVAYMADEFDADALMSAVGLYIAANSLGGIFGRVIGGFAGEHLGWNQAFLVISGMGLVLWLIVMLLLPKQQHFSPRPFHPTSMLADMKRHLGNPKLLPAYILGGLNFFIFVNQYSFITFVLEDAPYYLTPQLLGLMFLTYLTGTMGSTLSGKLGKQFGQPQCMMAGSVIMMIGTLTTLTPWLPVIILGFFINSFGFFFAHSSASSWVSRNAEGAKASASSLYLLFYYVGASSGGLYLNLFWQWQHWNGVIIGSLLVLIITLMMAGRLRQIQQRAESLPLQSIQKV